MPRDYAVVLPQFWTGATGRALRACGRDAQLVGAYLVTSPHANMIGLYHLPLAYLGHDLGMTLEGASEVLRSLGGLGFAHFDGEAEVVWVVEMARFQIISTGPALKPRDLRCKGVANELIKFRKSPFYQPFLDRYREVFHLHDMPGGEAAPVGHARGTEGASKPQRSQDQEQDQDQKKQQQQLRACERVKPSGPEAAEPAHPTPAAAGAGPAQSPAPEEDNGPAKEDPAEANAGTPGGSDPAARDGGDAAAAGIAAEPRGAAGPAPSAATGPEPGQGASPTCPVTPASSRGARPVVVDEVPRPPLEIVDEGGGPASPSLWPLAASFREALTLRMGRTVLYPVGGHELKIMASLQDSLGLIPEAEAVEICATRVTEAVQARRRQPGTMAYFAQVLADEAVRRRALGVSSIARVAPAALPDAGCPGWERMRGVLRDRERSDTFDRFHADLTGRMDGNVLVLLAPDPYRRRFLADNHAEVFDVLARELGVAEAVRFEAAAVAAAGGAT